MNEHVEKPGTIIILNGPSAVGKSSLVKAFLARQRDLWLHAGIDQLYVGVIPPVWLDDAPEHASVMTIKSSVDDLGFPVVKAVFGPKGFQVVQGMHRAIAAYAAMGNSVIVDYIAYESSWVEDFLRVTEGIPLVWVRVSAPLETIEARERARGTSPIGHARSHYESIHKGIDYSFCIDVDPSSPEEAAVQLEQFIHGYY